MKGLNRFKLLSIVLMFAYLLSACSGAAGQGTPAGGKPQPREVAFTGTVDAVGAGQITVSGQVVTLDAKSMMDPNIQVGDIVKVEAQVSDSGVVVAVKVESFGADDSNTNSSNANDANANDANTNDDNSNTGVDDNTNSANTNDDNSNDGSMAGGTEQEIRGVVEAISASSVTVGGVEYKFAASTEFKGAIFAGDTVKLHVIAGADGSLTVREIEKISGTSISGDDNSNDDNSNGNANDDDSNDDNGNDSNSNDDNGNDDDSNDDNSNSGSNSNDG